MHFHGDDEVSVRLTRRGIRERPDLRVDPRVRLAPRERDWVDVPLRASADVAFVVELVRRAIVANRR